jgi:hypothetical protein
LSQQPPDPDRVNVDDVTIIFRYIIAVIEGLKSPDRDRLDYDKLALAVVDPANTAEFAAMLRKHRGEKAASNGR